MEKKGTTTQNIERKNVPRIQKVHGSTVTRYIFTSASSAAALVFYLPDVCTHTDTKGKQTMARVGYILKPFKNKIFNEHPVSQLILPEK